MGVEGFPLDEATDWRDRAACLDEDPELFFPVGTSSKKDIERTEEAKRICQRCHVSEACLSWSLETGQDHGIWGGLTEDERSALKPRN
jgi:WhiB family redox-sensing transcriptional regulator